MYLTRLSEFKNSLQIFEVESVEALSEIISSKSLKLCNNIDSNLLCKNFSPLYTGIPMVTFGFEQSKSDFNTHHGIILVLIIRMN